MISVMTIIILQTYCFKSWLILYNDSHPPPAILLDDAVEPTGKVDLRWQQLEIITMIIEFTE